MKTKLILERKTHPACYMHERNNYPAYPRIFFFLKKSLLNKLNFYGVVRRLSYHKL